MTAVAPSPERGRQTFKWQPTWIDYRHSLVMVDERADAGDDVTTCTACGCETDVHPAPHSPKCSSSPQRSRGRVPPPFSREQQIDAIRAHVLEHGVPPRFADWQRVDPDRLRPAAEQVLSTFGSWNAGLVAAGFEPRRGGRARS